MNVEESRNTVIFGNYPQTENGEEKPIEWLELKREGGKALLISKYALVCLPYHPNRKDITWAESDLRHWLNDSACGFLQQAFSKEEQQRIEPTEVNTVGNAEFGTKGGNSVTDPIFLLSTEEAETYFPDNPSRKCSSTAFAQECSAGNCWWLRSAGYIQSRAAYVGSGGLIGEDGHIVDAKDVVVRPALWLAV